MGGVPYEQLCFTFDIKPDSIRAIARRMNLPKRAQLRPPPEGLAEALLEMGVEGARVHFKAGWSTIRRWMQELNLSKPPRKPQPKPAPRPLVIPADWAEVAPTLYKFEIAEHYRMGVKNINRIIEATGIRSRKTAHELAKERPPEAPRQRQRRAPRRPMGRHPVVDRSGVHSNITLYQQAANHLRRLYPNVHRCDIQMREFDRTTWGDEHKVPNHGQGFYYVAGRGVITNDDLIQLAERHGFCRASL